MTPRTLQGRPPALRVKTPGLARLAGAPEGAAPVVGRTPRVPFGIPADPDAEDGDARHRALRGRVALEALR